MNTQRPLKTALGMSSLLAMLAVSCAPSDPRLGPQSNSPVAASQDARPQEKFQPKVDILFVMDNAEAMSDHQENLGKNIDRFAQVFANPDGQSSGAKDAVDYHIGVTSLFDHTRFNASNPDCVYDNGQLRTLKHEVDDSAHPGQKTTAEIAGRNYATNQDGDIASILRATLKLGEQPFSKCGYKYEEQFGPVKALLSDAMINGKNAGFYRPDAELAVIFVGEADDETNDMTADQLKDILMAAKGGQRDRISVVSVTTSADANDNSCPRDKDGPPVKLHEIVNKMQGTYLNLCDHHYGDKLAQLAQMIRKKAMKHIIPLKVTPDVSTITVTYGGQVVPPGPNGWTYDLQTKSIVLNAEVESQGSSNEGISIDYVSIDLRNSLDADRIHVVY